MMSHMKLLCLAHAGGSATMYYKWNKMSVSVEILPLELPGRGTRWSEPLCHRIEEAAAYLYQKAIAHLERDEAYMLFGHSMGSLLAYELARLLRNNGYREPAHLFVSGGRAPHFVSESSYTYTSEEDFKNRILSYDPASNVIFEQQELYDLFIPILKADLNMLGSYVHKNKDSVLRCPITALAAIDDSSVPLHEAEAWKLYTDNVFSLKEFEGGHFFIHQQGEPILSIIQQFIQLD